MDALHNGDERIQRPTLEPDDAVVAAAEVRDVRGNGGGGGDNVVIVVEMTPIVQRGAADGPLESGDPLAHDAFPSQLFPEEGDHGDDPLGLLEKGGYTYEDTCRLAMRMGVAAILYGTTSGGVEKFLKSLMHEFGYYGVFRATLKEIFCSFQKSPDDLDSARTHIVECTDGINLHKLAFLSELATDVKQKRMSPQQASDRLEEIAREPNPWSTLQVAVSFFVVGAGLAAVFEGCWLDVILGSLSGGLFYAVMTIFEKQREEVQQWLPLTSAFVCTAFATLVKAYKPEVNVTLVTLSGVAILLPGYNVSLGTAELVTNHIMSGMTRLLQGCVVLLWLLTGSLLGKKTIESFMDISAAQVPYDPIPKAWYALFVPLLFLSVSVVLGNSFRDTPWAFLCMFIAYGTSLIASMFNQVNFGTFISSVAFTVFANVWANKMGRPNTLILTPAFLVKVSGSFGFLGLVRIVEGETDLGTEQFLQMFLVALLITAGMFAGNTVVPCATVL